MKKIANFVLFILVGTVIITLAAGMTIAADKILDTTVRDVKQAIDKRGVEYTRMIVTDQRELNGVKYETDCALMAFGDASKEAKLVKAGSKIKAIVSAKEYQGRTSYTLIKLLK